MFGLPEGSNCHAHLCARTLKTGNRERADRERENSQERRLAFRKRDPAACPAKAC